MAGGSPHFVGSMVYIEANVYQVADQPYLLVIDGQQRLTTFTLLIEALAAEQERRGTLLPGDFEPRKLRHYHLKDTFQDGERAYKLLLSETDRVTLKALIDSTRMPDNHSIRIKYNYDRFSEWMKSGDLDVMSRGLARVMIVDIALERGHDNPRLIFESLNSTGKCAGPSRPYPQLRADGPPAQSADQALWGALAADGARVWPGGIQRPTSTASCATT